MLRALYSAFGFRALPPNHSTRDRSRQRAYIRHIVERRSPIRPDLSKLSMSTSLRHIVAPWSTAKLWPKSRRDVFADLRRLEHCGDADAQPSGEVSRLLQSMPPPTSTNGQRATPTHSPSFIQLKLSRSRNALIAQLKYVVIGPKDSRQCAAVVNAIWSPLNKYPQP
jgi:hypothetical protein